MKWITQPGMQLAQLVVLIFSAIFMEGRHDLIQDISGTYRLY